MTGFYLMHRGWQDHPVFRNEEYSRRDAFVWMIEEASFKQTQIYASSGTITLKRGQLSHSLRFMAKAWKWDETKVRRFLSSLSKAKIIDAATDAGQTVITICNYEKYQTVEKQPDAATDAAVTQQRRGSDAKKNEGNELIQEEVTGNGIPGSYAFEGKVIKILPEQMKKWQEAYSSLDLRSVLQSRDDWLADQPPSVKKKWFIPTSNHLANLHGKARKANVASIERPIC
jgi:hypothetical protein